MLPHVFNGNLVGSLDGIMFCDHGFDFVQDLGPIFYLSV
jgi:hypothetical protein